MTPNGAGGGIAVSRMDAYYNTGHFIPFKRYMLQVVLDGRRKYNIARIRNRADALAEKAMLAAYRGILPVVVDTKT